MNAKTLSPAQASDETTDAQLANVSGGVRGINYNASMSHGGRQQGEAMTPTPQQWKQQQALHSPMPDPVKASPLRR